MGGDDWEPGVRQSRDIDTTLWLELAAIGHAAVTMFVAVQLPVGVADYSGSRLLVVAAVLGGMGAVSVIPVKLLSERLTDRKFAGYGWLETVVAAVGIGMFATLAQTAPSASQQSTAAYAGSGFASPLAAVTPPFSSVAVAAVGLAGLTVFSVPFLRGLYDRYYLSKTVILLYLVPFVVYVLILVVGGPLFG